MAKATKESAVKRELRSPKYRCRVVERKDLDNKINGLEITEIILDEFSEICDHGFLKGCPLCKKENT